MSKKLGQFKFMWFPNSCFYFSRIDLGSIIWMLAFWRLRINKERN